MILGDNGMEYIINIIGIGEYGKEILKALNENEYTRLVEERKNPFKTFVDDLKLVDISLIIRKRYFDENTDYSIEGNSWFNFIIYDNKDRILAANVAKNIKYVEYLNLGLCINGCDSVDLIKTIKVGRDDVHDIILNMLQPILCLPGMVGYDQIDIYNFFNTDCRYEILNFNGEKNDLNFQMDDILLSMNKFKDEKIQLMPILTTQKPWTLTYQLEFFQKIWDLEYVNVIDNTTWLLYFIYYLNKDILTLICKVK